MACLTYVRAQILDRSFDFGAQFFGKRRQLRPLPGTRRRLELCRRRGCRGGAHVGARAFERMCGFAQRRRVARVQSPRDHRKFPIAGADERVRQLARELRVAVDVVPVPRKSSSRHTSSLTLSMGLGR